MSKPARKRALPKKHVRPQIQKSTLLDKLQSNKKFVVLAIVVILAAIPFGLGKYFEFNSPGPFDSGAYVYSAKHIIEGALIKSGGSAIQPKHLHFLPDTMLPKDESSAEIPLNLQQAEVYLIKRALKQTNGNISEAARLLGITRPTLYSKLARAEAEFPA